MVAPLALTTAVVAALSLAILGYYLVVTANYGLLHALALYRLRREREDGEGASIFSGFSAPNQPGITIVVPAYNEAETIAESLPSFLNVDYPNVEILVVNDGSTDETLERIDDAFDLERAERVPPTDLPCEPIRGLYESQVHDDLVVVDKENGGKSDALNAGIWLADTELFCAVDSDTILERWSLAALVESFIQHPEETVAVGGTVRVANGSEFEGGEVVDIDVSRNRLASVQAMEYLRAFYLGRMGLAELDALILISGAFGVFDTEAVRAVGGYDPDTITEDFELVVRLHRHFREADRDYRIGFEPNAVAWTEAPVSLRVLGRQRRRWFRGRLETLRRHWRMIGNPRYGAVGLYGLPYFAFVETLAPLVEGLGYLVLPAGYALGVVDLRYFLLFLLITAGVGTVLSWLSLYGELLTPGGYDESTDIATLAFDAIIENVGYRQWKTAIAWWAVVEYLQGDTEWGEMERQGIESE